MSISMDTYRSSSDLFWEGLSLKSLKVLVEILRDHDHLESEVARRRFDERAQGFDKAVNFLEAVGAVKVDNQKIKRDQALEDMSKALSDGRQKFSSHLVRMALISETGYGRELREVCRTFGLESGQVKLKWGRVGGINYAARNVLLEGGAMRLHHSTESYSVSNWFLSDFIRTIYTNGLSPKELQDQKRDQADIGLAAELEVMDYERRMVGERDANMVVHVALENTAAGFDIASIRREESKSEALVRLIEVKAVSPRDWGFFFTRNEIQIAKKNGSSYFLYLVPVRNGKPIVDELCVIGNPVKELMNEHAWRIEQGAWKIRKREEREQ